MLQANDPLILKLSLHTKETKVNLIVPVVIHRWQVFVCPQTLDPMSDHQMASDVVSYIKESRKYMHSCGAFSFLCFTSAFSFKCHRLSFLKTKEQEYIKTEAGNRKLVLVQRVCIDFTL